MHCVYQLNADLICEIKLRALYRLTKSLSSIALSIFPSINRRDFVWILYKIADLVESSGTRCVFGIFGVILLLTIYFCYNFGFDGLTYTFTYSLIFFSTGFV